MADRHEFDAERRHDSERGADPDRRYQGNEYPGDYGRQRFGRSNERFPEHNGRVPGGSNLNDQENHDRESYRRENEYENEMAYGRNQPNWEPGGAEDYRSGRVVSPYINDERSRWASRNMQGEWSGGMGSPAGGDAGFGSGYGGGLGNYGSPSQNPSRYSGRGPESYQRPDDRIREDINERLTQQAEIDATEVEVQVSHGEVTLSGLVDQRHEKRIAEDIADTVSGVKDVHNNLRVQHNGQSVTAPSSSSSDTSAKSGKKTM